jgi:hypothetical protein
MQDITDFAAIEYLNASLAHALELDGKVRFMDFVREKYFVKYPDDSWVAFLEKMIGIQ